MLISFGNRIKKKHHDEFEEMRKLFSYEVLKNTPLHLRKMQEFGLQFTFFGNAPFLLHCLQELVDNGKLIPPTEEQKKSLHTIVIKK